MARIRVHCRYCPTTTLLSPEQVLLVAHRGCGTYLFFCPACARVSDGPAGPAQSCCWRPLACRSPTTRGRLRSERS